MPCVEEPLVVFQDEIAVGGVGGLELEPQVLELVLVVVGEERCMCRKS